MTLGAGHSKGAYGRTQIHPIWWNWQFCGGVFFPGCDELVSLHWNCKWWNEDCPILLWNIPQEFVCDAWMFGECAPPIPLPRMLGLSGFGDAVGYVEAEASDNINKIMFLCSCLMWNDAAVCGGRIWLNFFVSVWSDMWKYRERESAMMFYVPLMCCEYRDVSLLKRVHLSQQATESCDYKFTGSKYALYIQPSALELSVNAKMCDPCTSCRMVM